MYKVHVLNEYGKSRDYKKLEEWLNKEYEDGYELVGITNHNYSGYWVFKKRSSFKHLDEVRK